MFTEQRKVFAWLEGWKNFGKANNVDETLGTDYNAHCSFNCSIKEKIAKK